MKKLFSSIATLCFVVLAGVLVTACGGITTVDGGTAVYNASLTNWWQPEVVGENHTIDVSVTLNFDEINISDISKITFEIFDGETSMGSAVSEGEKLTNLFNEAKVYWIKEGQTPYTEDDAISTITGDGRILSCNFYEIDNPEDAEFFTNIWTYSKTTVHYVDGSHGSEETFPNKLVVKVLVGDTEYQTSYTVAA